jgi:UDP-glucose 4-epimerase
MNNILIIGASGYIGARLSYLLAKDGNNVTALCFSFVPKDKKWCSLMKEVVVGDITSDNVIDKITSQSFDVAIYLVSLDHYDSNKAPTFVNSVNVMPVWNLLESFKTKKTLKRFIYFSTIHVYGKIPNKVIEESHNTCPSNPYGLTHLLAENICNMYNATSEIDCINIRLSNSYGSPVFKENNCWQLVVNDLCRSAFRNKKIQLLSDGSPQRDFVHSLDLFQAIKLLINSNLSNFSNNIFNLSSGKTLTILEIAHAIKSVYKQKYKSDICVRFIDNAISENTDKFAHNSKYQIENKKLTSIGFNPKMKLEDGILEIFDFLEKIK